MKTGMIIRLIAGGLIVLSLGGHRAGAQWYWGSEEPVSNGGYPTRNGLALDDLGKLHLLYYDNSNGWCYKCKPYGEPWSTPENLPLGNEYNSPEMAVHKVTGVPYMVFPEAGQIKLGQRSGGHWIYHTLPTPGLSSPAVPTATVDHEGNVHVGMVGWEGTTPIVGYGYWDGREFHFQMIENSYPQPFDPPGTQNDPAICVLSHGSVALSYMGMGPTRVAENDAFGGTHWAIHTLDMPAFPWTTWYSCIQADPTDGLHVVYDIQYGGDLPSRILYTKKPFGAGEFAPSILITDRRHMGQGSRMVVEDSAQVHIVYTYAPAGIALTSCYATNQCGPWVVQYDVPGLTPGINVQFVMDEAGNGILVHDQILCYGSVHLGPHPPDVDVIVVGQPDVSVIPASGGNFNFMTCAANHEPFPVTFDLWAMLRRPNQASYRLLSGPVTLTLQGHTNLVRQRSQYLPASTPAGNYHYQIRIGDYPDSVWTGSSTAFIKLAGDEGRGGFDWYCTEEPFVRDDADISQPSAFSLSSHLNPFNPSTVLSFELRVPSHVSLKVYDVTGRLVATLVDGWQEAGVHEVTFDGSRLASGIYLAKLEASGHTSVQKLVLMK